MLKNDRASLPWESCNLNAKDEVNLGVFKHVVQWALHRNPTKRPTAQQFYDELKDVLMREHGIKLPPATNHDPESVILQTGQNLPSEGTEADVAASATPVRVTVQSAAVQTTPSVMDFRTATSVNSLRSAPLRVASKSMQQPQSSAFTGTVQSVVVQTQRGKPAEVEPYSETMSEFSPAASSSHCDSAATTAKTCALAVLATGEAMMEEPLLHRVPMLSDAPMPSVEHAAADQAPSHSQSQTRHRSMRGYAEYRQVELLMLSTTTAETPPPVVQAASCIPSPVPSLTRARAPPPSSTHTSTAASTGSETPQPSVAVVAQSPQPSQPRVYVPPPSLDSASQSIQASAGAQPQSSVGQSSVGQTQSWTRQLEGSGSVHVTAAVALKAHFQGDSTQEFKGKKSSLLEQIGSHGRMQAPGSQADSQR